MYGFLKSICFRLQLHDLQLTQFYGHFNITADDMKMTINLSQLKLAQLQSKRLRRIWSQTHLVPGLLVPHFLSPWINGPQKFGPHGQMVPNQFGPPG